MSDPAVTISPAGWLIFLSIAAVVFLAQTGKLPIKTLVKLLGKSLKNWLIFIFLFPS